MNTTSYYLLGNVVQPTRPTNWKLERGCSASNSGTGSNGMAFTNVGNKEGGNKEGSSKDNEMEGTILATQGKGGGHRPP